MDVHSNVILIGTANSHNNLLSQFLSSKLDCQCSCFEIEMIDQVRNKIIENNSIVLVDSLGLPASSVVDCVDILAQISENVKVAFFNVGTDFPCDKLLFWPHVRGIFINDANEENIVNGVKEINAGRYWLPRKVTAQLLTYLHSSPDINQASVKQLAKHVSMEQLACNDLMEQLTKRELHILKCICDGYSNVEIATDLKVSLSTVKTHAYNLFKKLNVTNRMQAANIARKLAVSGS